MSDSVNHPSHYESDSGVECIEVASPLPYALGNAVKYVWRAPHKGHYREDMRKAQWFLHQYITECKIYDGHTPIHKLVIRDLNVERAFGSSADPLSVWQTKVDIVINWLHSQQDYREGFFRALRALNVNVMTHAVDLIVYYGDDDNNTIK